MKVDFTRALTELLKNDYGLTDPALDVPEDGIEGNTLIVISTTNKYVAKFFDDTTRAQVIALFQHQLHAAQLSVPAIILTQSKSLTATLDHQTVVLSEFVDGRPIGWGVDFASLSGPMTVSIAKTVASIHKVSQALSFESKLSHSLSAKQILSTVSDVQLSSDLSQSRQAMIHADLARENILLAKHEDSVTALIDFGDAHFDYITYDIATLLTQVYVTKSWGVDFLAIKEFMTRYRQINPLQDSELQTILPLMKLRNQGLMEEIYQKLKENDPDRTTLESIKQSLSVKLQLLDQHAERLREMILQV